MRLGQRVVQVENSHIILTGAGALNKVGSLAPYIINRLFAYCKGGSFNIQGVVWLYLLNKGNQVLFVIW